MDSGGAAKIAIALEAFLKRGKISRVFLAGGITSPPQLAYLVHFPRLSIVLSGTDQMEIEQQCEPSVIRMTRGQAMFIPPNCWNRPAWIGKVRVLNILFGKRQTGMSLVTQNHRGEPTAAFKANFHRPIDGPGPGILQALISLTTAAHPSPTDCLLVEALLHSCLMLLDEPTRQPGGKADKTFQSICLYLQENFQFPLTRESVADTFELSPNHVSRLFRSAGFMKFTDYLTSVRLDRAKYLLRNHDRTLAQVANTCGFNDVGYFCRVFKRRTKLTPTMYRTQHPRV